MSYPTSELQYPDVAYSIYSSFVHFPTRTQTLGEGDNERIHPRPPQKILPTSSSIVFPQRDQMGNMNVTQRNSHRNSRMAEYVLMDVTVPKLGRENGEGTRSW